MYSYSCTRHSLYYNFHKDNSNCSFNRRNNKILIVMRWETLHSLFVSEDGLIDSTFCQSLDSFVTNILLNWLSLPVKPMLMHSPQFNPEFVFEVMVPVDVLGLYKLITMKYHMSEMSTLDYVKILCNNMGRWTVNLRRMSENIL